MSNTQYEHRVSDTYKLFTTHLKNFLAEANPTREEFMEFVKWADQLGRSGEIPLFMNVFIESSVLKNIYTNHPGTQPSLLGSYYIQGAPILAKPYQLPMRVDEKGEKLKFSGYVRDVNGTPLKNTLVDMWQCDTNGCYSSFNSDAPPYNLRGRFYTDEHGFFEVESVVPVPYQVATDGPTNQFIKKIDHQTYRPAHLHFMLKKKGYETLITQVFFEGDEWLQSDVADGVRPSLITQLNDQGDYKEATLNFVMRDLN
ncbi:dioxygenase family protein [Filobacillus milosensis]|uniref:dioxygenase family protein n=1 Tax=Filobacillus milosensis TaxID=94137 RepID=UPI001E429B7F|nr:dioxygenase [Filobacillus milosensis]